MRTYRSRITLFLVGASLLLAGAAAEPAAAQAATPSDTEDEEFATIPREQRERMIRQRIRQVFIRQLRARVDLSDQEMAELVPVLEELEADRVASMKRRGALATQLRGLVEDPESSRDELEAKLADLHEVEDGMRDAEERTRQKLETMLGPRQQAQVIVFRDEFRQQIEARLRDLRREMGQRDAMRRNRWRSGSGGSREERP